MDSAKINFPTLQSIKFQNTRIIPRAYICINIVSANLLCGAHVTHIIRQNTPYEGVIYIDINRSWSGVYVIKGYYYIQYKPYDPSLRDGRAASRPTCYAPGQRLAGAAPQTPLVGALRLRCEVGAARLQGVIAVNMFVIFVLELNSRRFAPPLWVVGAARLQSEITVVFVFLNN